MNGSTKALVIFVLFFGLVLSASAKDSPNPATTVRFTKTPARQEAREAAKKDMEEKRENMKQELEARREEFKQNIEEKREELKQRLEQKHEELKNRIETKKGELRERLKTIKDERKKQAVKRIDKRLDELNDRMTKHFLEVLNKLEDILVRIEERTDRVQDKGVDVTSVRIAIESAHKAVLDARAVVETQAGKTYAIEINIEDKLRADVSKTRQALHTDLKTVHEKVGVARNAIHSVATVLAQLVKANSSRVSPSVLPDISPSVLPEKIE